MVSGRVTNLAASVKTRSGTSDHPVTAYQRRRYAQLSEFRRGVEAAKHRHRVRANRWKKAGLPASKEQESERKLATEILNLADIFEDEQFPKYRDEQLAWARGVLTRITESIREGDQGEAAVEANGDEDSDSDANQAEADTESDLAEEASACDWNGGDGAESPVSLVLSDGEEVGIASSFEGNTIRSELQPDQLPSCIDDSESSDQDMQDASLLEDGGGDSDVQDINMEQLDSDLEWETDDEYEREFDEDHFDAHAPDLPYRAFTDPGEANAECRRRLRRYLRKKLRMLEEDIEEEVVLRVGADADEDTKEDMREVLLKEDEERAAYRRDYLRALQWLDTAELE